MVQIRLYFNDSFMTTTTTVPRLLHHTLQSLAPDYSLFHLLRRLLLSFIVNVHFGIVPP